MSESTMPAPPRAPEATEALGRLCEAIPLLRQLDVWGAHAGPIGPGWRIRPRILHGQLLMLVHDGRCRYMIAERDHELGPGMVLWMSEGVYNACTQLPPAPFSFSVLRFRLIDPADGADRSALPGRPWALMGPVGRSQPLWRDLMARTIGCWQRSRGGSRRHGRLAAAGLQSLLGLLADALAGGRPDAAGDPRVHDARARIDANPLARPTVGELAEQAGLSERHFASLFTRQVGRSPKQYMIAARMRHARFLLADGGMNVQQCAACLGYPDAFGFSRQFRQVIGRSPSAFLTTGGTTDRD